jgi:cathepsin L
MSFRELKKDLGSLFPYTNNFMSQIKKEFELFKTTFERTYTNLFEEAERFMIFSKNFLHIERHNRRYDNGEVNYKLKLNEFSDKNSSELKHLHGCFLGGRSGSVKSSKYVSPATMQSLPRKVDWNKKGAVTHIKNQGRCGSCWTFSTTGTLEGQHYRKTGELVSLSEQQLVDCSGKYGEMGCDGGLMDMAYDYIEAVGGIDTEQSYPYVSGSTQHKQAQCYFRKGKVGATVTGHVDLPAFDEDKLKEAVANVGPIAVAIDASAPDFMYYHSGVYTSETCSQTRLDHGVLVVGYGVEMGEDYWLVKNSWGPQWGDMGFIKMRRNYNNMCGIATNASYPLV